MSSRAKARFTPSLIPSPAITRQNVMIEGGIIEGVNQAGKTKTGRQMSEHGRSHPAPASRVAARPINTTIIAKDRAVMPGFSSPAPVFLAPSRDDGPRAKGFSAAKASGWLAGECERSRQAGRWVFCLGVFCLGGSFACGVFVPLRESRGENCPFRLSLFLVSGHRRVIPASNP